MDRPQDPPAVPSVSIVMPCRNEARTIAAVLDAIQQQDLAPHEVIVVNDQSTDRTPAVCAAWARTHPDVTLIVIDGPGRGPSAAMNAGIARARGEIIVRLDGHCRPRVDYVRRSVTTMMERNAGVVGGVWEIEPSAATMVARAIAAVAAHPIGSGGADYRDAAAARDSVREVDTVPFGTFRREAWEAAGGYDEALVSNEDYDFNYRMRQMGLPVLLDTSVRSVYGSRPTLAALARQYFRYGFWKTQMLRKSPEAIRFRQVPPALLLPWLGSTVVIALTMTGLAPLLVAALYPGFVAAVGVQIAILRRDSRLVAPAFATIVVQHAAWSAGFWHGLAWPPSGPPDQGGLPRRHHRVIHITE